MRYIEDIKKFAKKNQNSKNFLNKKSNFEKKAKVKKYFNFSNKKFEF